jgi:hypothetical protein
MVTSHRWVANGVQGFTQLTRKGISGRRVEDNILTQINETIAFEVLDDPWKHPVQLREDEKASVSVNGFYLHAQKCFEGATRPKPLPYQGAILRF